MTVYNSRDKVAWQNKNGRVKLGVYMGTTKHKPKGSSIEKEMIVVYSFDDKLSVFMLPENVSFQTPELLELYAKQRTTA